MPDCKRGLDDIHQKLAEVSREVPRRPLFDPERNALKAALFNCHYGSPCGWKEKTNA